MPNGWTRVSTPEDLQELLERPNEFKREVQGRVARSGAALQEIYFERSGRPAYVLVAIPGSVDDAGPIVEKLEKELGSEVQLLLTAEELPNSSDWAA
jgi:hypothetical protein